MHDDDAVVSCITDDEITHVVDGNALRSHELSVSGSLTPEDSSGGPVGVDDENVVNVEVGHDDVAIIIKGNPTWRIKVTTEIPLVAKLSK